MKNHYTTTMNHHNNHPNYYYSSSSSSFSSSLLEQIYRSFDDDDNNNNHKIRDTSQSKINTKRNTTSTTSNGFFYDVMLSRDERKQFSSRHEIHPYVLQQWMEDHKVDEKESKVLKLRRNYMPEDGKFRRNNVYSSSSTSSSDSSSGIGGFSSSDTDSVTGPPTRINSKVSSLKPIRTAACTPDFGRKSYSDETPAKKCKKDGKFQHALKLYAELKKAKEPISPGGKLASFLNSLFNSGNSKKPKIEPMTSSSLGMKSSSVPSTASSYSRSCLSKTPSSAGRYERRSVRFCPVNVVVDETGLKSVYNEDGMKADAYDDVDFKMKILGKQKGVEEAAKKMLNNNNNNKMRRELKVNVIGNNNKFEYNWNNVNMRSLEDEDDEESCCSSDLFELDNLLEVHELPVYETTHVRTNRAIAKGVSF